MSVSSNLLAEYWRVAFIQVALSPRLALSSPKAALLLSAPRTEKLSVAWLNR